MGNAQIEVTLNSVGLPYAGRTNNEQRTTNDEQLKIELLSQWKLEAEFRNIVKSGDWSRW